MSPVTAEAGGLVLSAVSFIILGVAIALAAACAVLATIRIEVVIAGDTRDQLVDGEAELALDDDAEIGHLR